MDRKTVLSRVVPLAVVGLLLIAGASWFALRSRTEEAPQFRLQSVGPGNETLDLTAARGKVVVLDLMAVNCAACKTLTIDVLKPIWAEYGAGQAGNASGGAAPDVLLWSIDVWAGGLGESAEDLAALQATEGSGWPHALDDGTVFGHFQPDGLPKLAVIDPEGRITYYAGVGAVDLDLPRLAAVQEAIEAARTSKAETVGIPQSGLAGLALFAGAAVVFSPCSIGLLPAYFGMLLRERAGRPGPVRGGIETSAGVVAVYAGITVLLVPFSSAILPMVPMFGIVMGALFVALGIAMLAKVDWGRLLRGVRRDKLVPDGGSKGYWLFGIGYALASFGCTGPIFVPLVASAFASSFVAGVGIFALYAAGIAALLVFIALLAAMGRENWLRHITAKSVWVTRVVAVVWMGAGAYLLWYDMRALGWVAALA